MARCLGVDCFGGNDDHLQGEVSVFISCNRTEQKTNGRTLKAEIALQNSRSSGGSGTACAGHEKGIAAASVSR